MILGSGFLCCTISQMRIHFTNSVWYFWENNRLDTDLPSEILKLAGGFVAQMSWWDSLYEASVISESDEQLGPYEVQDQELVVLQWYCEAALIIVNLVWSRDGLDITAKWQTRSATAIQWRRCSNVSDAQGPLRHAASPDNRVHPEPAAACRPGMGYARF